MSDTIVMIHGMWGGAWNWDNFRAYFGKKGYECITPTLRFHDMDPDGIPDLRLGLTSLLDYAKDLENEIRKIPGAPNTWNSHTMPIGSLENQVGRKLQSVFSFG